MKIFEDTKRKLVFQASQSNVEGPFTDDEIEGMETANVTKVINYVYNQTARFDAEHARTTLRRAIVFTVVVVFGIGMLVENIRSSLMERPLVRSMNELTAELRNASSAKALLDTIRKAP